LSEGERGEKEKRGGRRYCFFVYTWERKRRKGKGQQPRRARGRVYNASGKGQTTMCKKEMGS
jgi:hypothetical protein